jgi:hypothetical protein
MPAYFDFTVSLQNVLPRPWRRFLLRANASFATLHSAIQDACGWSNSHLYEFRTCGEYAPEAIAGLRLEDGEDDLSGPMPSARTTRLTRYFGRGAFTTALYLYDFGDGWTHDVQLNDVVGIDEKVTRRLLGGEHAFPPDDCGGPLGYEELQEAIRTGKDPEGLIEWASSVWGWTGIFDLDEARRRFAHARKR